MQFPGDLLAYLANLYTDCLEPSSKVPNLRDFCSLCFLVPEATVMESSHVLGEPEKWSSSSESGWTMYIGSQIHYGGEDDNDGDDDDDVCFITDKEKHDKRNVNNNNDDDDDDDNEDNHDESDDSMASDASSGPTLQEFPCENKEGLLRNHAFRVDQNKYSSRRKACKQLQKNNKRDERRNIKAEKQQSVRKADSAASQV